MNQGITMAFVDDITERGSIHLVKDNDLRDLAVRNIWRGLMLAEQHTGQKIKYDQKVKLVQQACVINNEPVGEKMIERIVVGVKL